MTTMSLASRVRPLALAALTAVLFASPARADITAFIGTNTTPSNRTAKGFAVGAGLLIIAFEFEYASSNEDQPAFAPSLTTGMGNVLLQSPLPILRMQPYFTTGAGGYRETLGAVHETGFGSNVGGGVKVSLVGPLRLRFDYRVFTLQGDPRHEKPQRFYAGVNLKF